MVNEEVIHISEAFPTPGKPAGQCNATDAQIVEWCAKTEHVLITVDQEFYGRWARSGLLQKHGVEVIVFTQDLQHVRYQHSEVTRHLPYWEMELCRQPYGHRVWAQHRKTLPPVPLSKAAKRKARRGGPFIAAPS